jgi:hypothetical protein
MAGHQCRGNREMVGIGISSGHSAADAENIGQLRTHATTVNNPLARNNWSHHL